MWYDIRSLQFNMCGKWKNIYILTAETDFSVYLQKIEYLGLGKDQTLVFNKDN